MGSVLRILAAIGMVLVINAALSQTPPSLPNGVTEKEFATIRAHCAQQWSDNYEMREYCEQKQIEAIQKLKSRGPIDQR
jgi:hypothetical protein